MGAGWLMVTLSPVTVTGVAEGEAALIRFLFGLVGAVLAEVGAVVIELSPCGILVSLADKTASEEVGPFISSAHFTASPTGRACVGARKLLREAITTEHVSGMRQFHCS